MTNTIDISIWGLLGAIAMFAAAGLIMFVQALRLEKGTGRHVPSAAAELHAVFSTLRLVLTSRFAARQ